MARKLPFGLTVLLLLSLGISSALYLFFDVAQLQLKMDAQKEIGAMTNLQTVRLPVSDFNANIDKKEIWINGKLYDISSYVIVRDYVLVSVFHDEREEGLVKSIIDLFESNDSYSNNGSVHLTKHRVHLPDDGKVLVDRCSVHFIWVDKGNMSSLSVAAYSPQPYSAVIKPPPRNTPA